MMRKTLLSILATLFVSLAWAQCPPAAALSTPYFENFDTVTAGVTGSSFNNCWISSTTSDPNWESQVSDGTDKNSTSTGPLYDHTMPGISGGVYIFMEVSSGPTGDTSYFTSPDIDLSGVTIPELRFWYHMYGSQMGTLAVEVFDGLVWTQEWTLSGQQQTAGSDPWRQAIVNISSYSGIVKVRFRGEKGAGFEGDMSIDDVSVQQQPTCPLPSNISVSSITPTGASLSWTGNGANTIVEYGPTGFAIGTGTRVVATGSPYSLGGLMGGTVYDFYLTDSCAPTDLSDTAGPVTFQTPCASALNGTYTINGSMATGGTNYASFSEAASALDICGVSGAVTFNVSAGTYTDHLHIIGIPGVSSTNTVTFNGSGTDTLVWDQTGPQAAVLLDTAPYVTLNNLNIVNSAPTAEAWGVLVTNGSDNVTIDGCYIEMNSTSTSSDISAILISSSYTNDQSEGAEVDSLVIQNNVLVGGYFAINLEGSFSLGFSLGNRVLDNMVSAFSNAGIYLDEMQDIVISGNTFQTTRPSVDGIYCNDMNDYVIEKNTVNVTDWGIYIIDGNDGVTPATRSKVVNNMVTSTTDYAIYLNDFEATDVFHNSSMGFPAIAVNDQVDMDVRNNIFVATTDFAFESFDALTVTDVIDYNVYNSANTNAFDIGPTTYVDLAAWQAADGTRNVNSLEGDPVFVSATNLHALGTLANDVGAVISSVTDDIDGDPRSGTTPDIGADEFSPASCFPSTNLMAVSIGQDSVTLSWNAGSGAGFIIEYGAPGFSIGTGTTVSTMDTFITVSGLMAASSYHFYVTDSCGAASFSLATGPLSVNTLCNAFSLPFAEDFGPFFPNCWNTNDSTYANTSTSCAGSNGNTLVIFSPNGTFAETPVIDASGQTSVKVSYQYRAGSSTCGNAPEATDSVGIDYWDGAQWVNLIKHNGGTPIAFTPVSFIITNGLTAGFKVRFFLISGTTTNFDSWAFDSVRVEVGPNCAPATNLGATNITTNSAVAFFQSGSSKTVSLVEYGPQGFVPGSGIVLPTTTDSLNLIGLTQNTCYDFYVTDSCTGNSQSAQAGPFTFCTDCGVINLPYTESFDSPSNSKDCWTINNPNPWDYSTTVSAFGNGDGSVIFPYFSVSSGTHDFISPDMSASLSGYELSFDHAYAAYSIGNPIDTLEIHYSTNGGMSYTLLDTLLGGANGRLNTATPTSSSFVPIGTDWSSFSIGLPTGTNKIIFRAISDFGNNLYLDNISIAAVQSGPSCAISTTPTVNNDSLCTPDTARFIATAGSGTPVYLNTNGIAVSTGDKYNVFTGRDTSFLVADRQLLGTPQHVGPLTSIATAGFGNFTNGQWITVLDTISIDSTTVRADGGGVVTAFVQILDDAGGNVIQRGDTFTTGATLGDYQVPVNVTLTPGNYFINVDFLSGGGQLFRATSGAVFPYVLPGLITIDSVNFTGARYYYTFDLVVSEACLGTPDTAFAYIIGRNAGAGASPVACDNGSAIDIAGFVSPDADMGGTYSSPNAAGALSGSMFDPNGLSAGTYTVYYLVSALAGCPADTAEFTISVQSCGNCATLMPPVLTGDTSCTPGFVTLTGTTSATDVVWYDSTGNVFVYGGSFTDSIGATTQYKAASVLRSGPGITAGPAVTDFPSNVYPTGNFTNGQFVTAHQTVRLDSTTIAADGPVQGVVVVSDVARTQVLQVSKVFNLNSADTIPVELGIVLDSGSYFINVSILSGTGVMWRPTGGANFTYGVSNLFTSDSSDFGPTRYYYLYELKVSGACVSSMDSVLAVVDPTGGAPSAGMDVSDTICDTLGLVDLRNLLVGADAGGSWSDLDGSGGLLGNFFDPDTNQSGNTYRLQYVISDTCGSDTSIVTLYIEDCGISLNELPLGQIAVYPNPAKNVFYVENQVGDAMEMELYNLNGKLLISRKADGSETEAIDVSNFADGVYNLRITTQDGVAVKRVIKQ